MSGANHACGKCGASVGPGDRFCMRCGTPQGPVAQAADQPGPDSGERVLGVVSQVVEVKGFLGKDTLFLNLVVTNQRLILAEQPDVLWDRMDALEKEREERFRKSGMPWREFLNAGDGEAPPWSYYLAMPAGQILAERPGNRQLSLLDVSLVTLALGPEPPSDGDDLTIRHQGDFLEFALPWANGEEAARVLGLVTRVEIQR